MYAIKPNFQIKDKNMREKFKPRKFSLGGHNIPKRRCYNLAAQIAKTAKIKFYD